MLCVLCVLCAEITALAGQAVGKPDPASAPESVPVYRWKPRQVYRFRYHKQVTLQCEEGAASTRERVTLIEGILVFRVEQVAADGSASGSLRFDSPRVHLPEVLLFNDTSAQFESGAARSRLLARATEETLRRAGWKVQLGRHGRLRVLKRDPASLQEWMRRVQRAGRWPGKFIRDLERVVEQRFQLGVGRVDEELLVVFGRGAPRAKADAPFEALRPLRKVRFRQRLEGEKTEWALLRQAAPGFQPGLALKIPHLNGREPGAWIALEKVKGAGRAVFDTRLGMLDQAEERYRATLRCATANAKGPPARKQTLRVEYRIKRLAPPLRKVKPRKKAAASP